MKQDAVQKKLIQAIKEVKKLREKTDNFITKYNFVMANTLKKHKKETDSLNFRIALLEKENEKLTLQNEGLRKLEGRVESMTIDIRA